MSIHLDIVPNVLSPDDESFVSIQIEALHSFIIARKLGTSNGRGQVDSYENDVFMTHASCNCGSEDCGWCSGCTCPDYAYHFYLDGIEVNYNQYQEFFETEMEKLGVKQHAAGRKAAEEWDRKVAQINARRTEKHDKICDFCQTGAQATAKGGGPGIRAPNFWHRKSGLRVWWSRGFTSGTRITVPPNTKSDDLPDIFVECILSVKKKEKQ